ncbi:MAG: hypothetical protein IGS39_17345 [Calothrix sp. C42_A2020_038]|nr:hypothetical protein [Calothrix sp. C42_A2020_038]
MSIKSRLVFIILLVTIVAIPVTLSFATSGDATQALAETSKARKAKASRLFKQGINQYQTNQYQAAFRSWLQAIMIYQQTKKQEIQNSRLRIQN